jgi:hypothetical protein
MDRVLKPNISESYTPSSESYNKSREASDKIADSEPWIELET